MYKIILNATICFELSLFPLIAGFLLHWLFYIVCSHFTSFLSYELVILKGEKMVWFTAVNVWCWEEHLWATLFQFNNHIGCMTNKSSDWNSFFFAKDNIKIETSNSSYAWAFFETIRIQNEINDLGKSKTKTLCEIIMRWFGRFVQKSNHIIDFI